MNYNLIMKFLSFFKVNDSFKAAKYSLLSTLVVGFISYSLLVIYRVGDPDTIIEGLTYYMNATWAIVGCGRWLLPIINVLSGNVVMPIFIVTFYCFIMWLSAFLITKIWNINKTILVIVITVVMAVTPSTIIQLIAIYMGCDFAIACLLATLFVYFCFNNNNKFSYLICVVCITLMLASYQSYISYAACLSLMTIIIKCLIYEYIDYKNLIKAIITALIGCFLYLISYKVVLAVFSLESSSRMAEFSIKNMFTNLPKQILYLYNSYFGYFKDSIMQRYIIYALLIITLIICLISIIANKKYQIKNKIVIIICLLLIPLASNLVSIIIPKNPITPFMTYQYILTVPFIVCVCSHIDTNKFNSFILNIIVVLSLALTWTHIVSANATYQCYKMSYDYVNNQFNQVVYDIEHFDGYEKDKTPVLIVGFFKDDTLRNNIKTYDYAIDLKTNLFDNDLFDNLVFWEDSSGVTFNRQRYFLQYFGLDFKEITFNDYSSIINTNEFSELNTWPDKNSIKMINDYLVVKIGENYVK